MGRSIYIVTPASNPQEVGGGLPRVRCTHTTPGTRVEDCAAPRRIARRGSGGGWQAKKSGRRRTQGWKDRRRGVSSTRALRRTRTSGYIHGRAYLWTQTDHTGPARCSRLSETLSDVRPAGLAGRSWRRRCGRGEGVNEDVGWEMSRARWESAW